MSVYNRIPSRRRRVVRGKIMEYYHKPTDRWYTLGEILSNEMEGLPLCTVQRCTLANRISYANSGKTKSDLDTCIGKSKGKQWQTRKPKSDPTKDPDYVPRISFHDVHKLMTLNP